MKWSLPGTWTKDDGSALYQSPCQHYCTTTTSFVLKARENARRRGRSYVQQAAPPATQVNTLLWPHQPRYLEGRYRHVVEVSQIHALEVAQTAQMIKPRHSLRGAQHEQADPVHKGVVDFYYVDAMVIEIAVFNQLT